MQLNGTWYNELKSHMILKVNGNVLTGTYHNAAGLAAGDYDLYGIADPDDTIPNRTVAWTVAWKRKGGDDNFNSVTSWSGQLQTIGGVDTITAEWLLTAATSPDDDWASTKIGHDVFTHNAPAPELAELKMKHTAPSHPVKKSKA